MESSEIFVSIKSMIIGALIFFIAMRCFRKKGKIPGQNPFPTKTTIQKVQMQHAHGKLEEQLSQDMLSSTLTPRSSNQSSTSQTSPIKKAENLNESINSNSSSDRADLERSNLSTAGGHEIEESQYDVLRSNLRIFSHLEEDILYQVIQGTEVVTLSPGQILFRIGDMDDSFYVVQEGTIKLFAIPVKGLIPNTSHSLPTATEGDENTETLISERGPGEHLTSLLSIADVLSGGVSKYKTLKACAGSSRCILLRVRAAVFQSIIQEKPRAMHQLIKIITLKLRRVTLSTLYKFFGLTSELTKSDGEILKMPLAVYNKEANDSCGEQELLKFKLSALEDFLSTLSLKVDVDEFFLETTLLRYSQNAVIVKQGEMPSYLYFVVSGKLEAYLHAYQHKEDEHYLYSIFPRDVIGETWVLSAHPSLITVKAKGDACVLRIPVAILDKHLAEQPVGVGLLFRNLLKRISPFVRQSDFALEWLYTTAGKEVYKQETLLDASYIVLSGRLRSVRTKPGSFTRDVIAEHGRFEIIGEAEVMSNIPYRRSSLHVVRDSELVKVPVTFINFVQKFYPQILLNLLKAREQRVSLANKDRVSHAPLNFNTVQVDLTRRSMENVALVAFVPLSDRVPLSSFVATLAKCIQRTSHTVAHIDRSVVSKELYFNLDARANEYKIFSWLSDKEDKYDMVLLEGDAACSQWTLRCIRQADCVVFVGLGKKPSALTQLEHQIRENCNNVFSHQEVAILYDPDAQKPQHTREWLEARPWCTTHHNIRFSSLDPASEIDNTRSDLYRLTRHYLNKSVGLVLGGGGARGLAHIGAIRALEENGVPIDMVGGTSIGAFFSALYAEETALHGSNFMKRTERYCGEVSSILNQLGDLTYPHTAVFTGRTFNRIIHETFGDRMIEDLWIPFYCVTTNVSDFKMRIHTSGSLWHYVRGSMTLVGLLPPICDPKDASLLVDGGYGSVMPTDMMYSVMGATTVISVDVSRKEPTDFEDYGSSLNGFIPFFTKWLPFIKPRNYPEMTDMFLRLSFLQSNIQFAEFEKSYKFLVHPPIDSYGTLEWRKMDEIVAVGYAYALPMVQKWVADKALPFMVLEERDKPL